MNVVATTSGSSSAFRSVWTFGFDNAKTRAGLCDYSAKRITVSRYLAVRYGDDEIHQILLHEVAHALAGSRAGHGPRWRSELRDGEGLRRLEVEMKRAVILMTVLAAGAAGQALNCDLSGYKAQDGLKAQIRSGALELTWQGERNEELRATFSIRRMSSGLLNRASSFHGPPCCCPPMIPPSTIPDRLTRLR